MSEKQHRIFWDDKEWHDMIVEAKAIISKDPDLHHDSVFRMAQQVLSPNRRRPVHSSAVAKFWKRVKSSKLRAPEGHLPPAERPTEVVSTVPQQTAQHKQEAIASMEATQAPMVTPGNGETTPFVMPTRTLELAPEDVPSVSTALAAVVSDTILQVLYNPQIRIALRTLVGEALAPESELEQIQATTWREPKLGRERPMRVVIAGGGGVLHAEMQRPIAGVDVRLWGLHADESMHRLRAILQSADVAVAVVKYVRHGAMWAIKEREKQGKLKAIYWGGSSAAELRQLVENLKETKQ